MADYGTVQAPDGAYLLVSSNIRDVFSDDFGGTLADPKRWTVVDGGQANIGTGITGITDSIAASAMTVAMGTVNNAERWYLSNAIFSGSKDITVVCSKSQPIAANSIFIGMVEVDTENNPILNPNLANDFNNRGGVEFGKVTGASAYAIEAVADASPAMATVTVGSATAVLTSTQEFITEFTSEDIIASTNAVDALSGKGSGAIRLSSQVPSDMRRYKLLMRFRNIGTPGSNTNFVINRILVVPRQDQRVEIVSGRGDVSANKAVLVNLTSSAGVIGAIAGSNSNTGVSTAHKLISAATTNPTAVTATAARLYGGVLHNTSVATKFVKFYNKATAPTVGTDTPVLTIPVPPSVSLPLNSCIAADIGYRFATGLAYAITGAAPDADTTAVAAGDVIVNLIYA